MRCQPSGTTSLSIARIVHRRCVLNGCVIGGASMGRSMATAITHFRIITLWRGTSLIGAVPLYENVVGGCVLGSHRLMCLSTGEAECEETCADYLGLLCLPGEETPCLDALSQMLREISWDQVHLVSVSECSPLVRLMPKWKARWWAKVVPRGVCRIADLSKGFDAFVASLSPRARRHVSRHLRQIQDAGATLETACEANIDEFFDDLVRLHQERWTGVGKPGCFASTRFTGFHRTLGREWVPVGKAVLARLMLAGKAVAVIYGFVNRSKFDFYQSGRTVVATEPIESPGIAIHLMLMAELAKRGVTAFDYLIGSSLHKNEFTNEQCNMFDVKLHRLTPRTVVHETSRILGRILRRGIRCLRRR